MSLAVLDFAEFVAGLFEMLIDFGLAIGAGTPFRWRSVLGLWLLAGVSGIPFWRNYPRFFDASPGWAALCAVLWLVVLVVALGVTVAKLRGPASVLGRSRPASIERCTSAQM